MGTRLPTTKEISPFGSIDELHALKHFLGKDLEQAEALFRENFRYYNEDLMFMGPKAFAFYVPAAIRYLLNAESSGDSAAAYGFYNLIKFRLDTEPDTVSPVGPIIREAILGMLGDFDRYGCYETVPFDLEASYRDLLSNL